MTRVGDRFITLLRHGEPLGGGRFRGSTDDAPSAAGRCQIEAAGRRALEAQPATCRIIASTARRCAEPARRLAEANRLSLALSEAFAERHFGDWEGLGAERIPAPDLARFWADPSGYTPPGAEPFDAFRARVLAAWDALASTPHGDELVITHGGVIRVVLAEILAMADPAGLLIEVPYACATRIRVPALPGRPSLISHGARGEDESANERR